VKRAKLKTLRVARPKASTAIGPPCPLDVPGAAEEAASLERGEPGIRLLGWQDFGMADKALRVMERRVTAMEARRKAEPATRRDSCFMERGEKGSARGVGAGEPVAGFWEDIVDCDSQR